MELYAVCINTSIGMLWKGNSQDDARTLSLTTQILLSILPTCSLAAVVLISRKGHNFLTGSNSLSINANHTINPPFVYKYRTSLSELANCFAVRVGINSIVVNPKFLE